MSCPDEMPDLCAIPAAYWVAPDEVRSALLVVALAVDAAQSCSEAADGPGTAAALRSARVSVDWALRLVSPDRREKS